MDQTGAVFPFCICHHVFLQRPSQTVIYQISFALNLNSQLSAMDASVRTTMKGAAKCDKHCELQNSVNQQGFERILRFRDIPESMPASVSTSYHASGAFLAPRQVKAGLRVSVHLSANPGLRCI